jgi:outer membrane protein assembly factor BamB
LATFGHLVFVTVESRVRAYDIATGALMWERDATDAHGKVILNTLEAAAGLVVVAGYKLVPVLGLPRPRTNVDLAVRVYAAANGRLVWEDQFDKASDSISDDYASAVAVRDGRVFIAGQSCQQDVASCAGTVRAYRARSGALLWSRISKTSSASFAVASSADSRTSRALVVVAGVSNGSAMGGPDRGVVQTYDAEDGTLAWAREQDVRNDGSSNTNGFYDAIAVLGERVFVGGSDGRPLVQAYDLNHGDSLWTSVASRDGSIQALTVSRGQVFAVGTDYELFGTTPGGDDRTLPRWTVRAFDAEAGTMLWDDEVAETTIVGIARDDDVEKNRLFVVGFAIVRSDGGTHGCTADDYQLCSVAVLVRAYDARPPR